MPIEIHTHLLAAKINENVQTEIEKLMLRGCRVPHVYILKIGTNFFMSAHVNAKQQACARLGIRATLAHFSDDVPYDVIIKRIMLLNEDPDVDGIIIQLPLPSGLSPSIINAIDARKDVANMTTQNLSHGRKTGFECLLEYGTHLDPKSAVVVVDAHFSPIALHMLNTLGYEKRIGLIGDPLLPHIISQSDLVLLGPDVRWQLNWDWVKDDAIIFDLGAYDINAVLTKNNVGNLAPEVAQLIEWFMPMSGSNGPLATAMALRNAVTALLEKVAAYAQDHNRAFCPIFRQQSARSHTPSSPLCGNAEHKTESHAVSLRNSLS